MPGACIQDLPSARKGGQGLQTLVGLRAAKWHDVQRRMAPAIAAGGF